MRLTTSRVGLFLAVLLAVLFFVALARGPSCRDACFERCAARPGLCEPGPELYCLQACPADEGSGIAP